MTFNGTLLPYQPEAVEKMKERGQVLVSYDMGLGKTVLTIAAIEDLRDEGSITAPGLVIALATLKYQWKEAIEFFSNSDAIVIDGSPKDRERQYEQAMDWQSNNIRYIVTNYEMVWRDIKQFRHLPREFIVCDEATAIKNFRSKRSKAVKSLKTDLRFALTGTPVENGKPEELFSIMQFVDPSVLGPYPAFDNAFIVRNAWGGVERYRNLPLFHDKMKEASVRKSQSDPDVAPFLPQTLDVEPFRIRLDSKAAKVYNHMVADLLDSMQDIGWADKGFSLDTHYGVGQKDFDLDDEVRGKIMSIITCMRMLCDNPALLRTSAARANDMWDMGGSKYAAGLAAKGLLEGLDKTPKLDLLVSYVKDLLDADDRNKIVVFSTFVDTLDYIADRIGPEMCVTYSGRMTHKEKDAAKVKFNSDPKLRVFISSDAGGYGVDIPSANTLINYDLPWSPGLYKQRNGRIQRASSKWSTICITDMMIKGSVEEWQYDKLKMKNDVADAIIDGKNINTKGGVDMSVDSLAKYLRASSV